jgi:hypothetical protein
LDNMDIGGFMKFDFRMLNIENAGRKFTSTDKSSCVSF